MTKLSAWFGTVRSGAETRFRWMMAKPRGPSAPGRASAVQRSDAHSLVLSDWLVLSGLALAVLWSRTNKFIHLESISITAHFPGAVFLAGFVLCVVGGALFCKKPLGQSFACPPSQTLWPLLLLSAYILAGSNYLQYIEKERNTFRIAGGYMLTAYMLARVVMMSTHPGRLVMSYFVLLAVSAVPTFAVALYFFTAGSAGSAPFHELEFFVLPLAVFWVTRSRDGNVFAIILFWCAVASALIFRKNTAYLVAFGMVVYTWLFHWRVGGTRASALQHLLGLLFGLVILLSAAGAYLYMRHTTVDLVPTGNTEFRLAKYAIAWQRFMESPLWGTAYLKPAAQLFEDYDTGVAGNVLPTHSDLMDLLAHGGLIAAALWGLAHILLLRAVHKYILSRRNELSPDIIALTHTLCCMVLLGILTYAFNPLWLNPTRALLVWANLGLLAGLVAVYSRKPNAVGLRPQLRR